MRNKLRFAVVGLLVAAGFALAPAAFARGHLNLGINIGLPGLSLGYSGCHHCGWGGYYGGGYYPGYAYAAPVYYGPTYYEPAYDSYPTYGAVYYSDRGYDRGYDRDRRHDRDEDRGRRHYSRDDNRRGDYGHRASYYDRSGYDHR